ncbi:MAG: Rne/Rng family ribonuclease, partial [Geminicoccaceae bacterium]
RKITNAQDRKRLKEVVAELDVPEGMGVILRTAGESRTKAEIKRDYEYLLRLWNEIRETTLKSVAPKLIYEEGDLIKRAMRDLYTRDIEEVLVEGDDGYRAAKRLMTMLMPSRARLVKQYREETPLFFAYRVEDQLDAMHSPTVQLPSGGSIVIHTTEALTAIDVNSGRSTRERHIDETAVKTNLEAADEVSRQLRLRDLAGLIVIDFIDMAEGRHQRSVEKRLREALKSDRARIQMGKISQFGLMELSRQRLRASLQELSSQVCPHCAGLGVVRSTESCVLQTLRAIQEAGIKGDVAVLAITAPGDVALYLLNQKREALSRLEQRYAMRVMVHIDHELVPPAMRLDVAEKRNRERERAEAGRADLGETSLIDEPVVEEAEDAAEPQARVEAGPKAAAQRRPAGEESEEGGARRRRKRRRRRRRPGEVGVAPEALGALEEAGIDQPEGFGDGDDAAGDVPQPELEVEPAPLAVAAAVEPLSVETEGEITTSQPAAAELLGEEPVAEMQAEESPAPAKPRRVRKPRARKAAVVEAAPAEETGVMALAAPDVPARTNGAGHEEDAVAETSEAPAAVVPDLGIHEPQPEADEESQPQRQGWWSRWVR